MKALHAEGKAGPQFGKLGGRPRKPRASELAAQEAEANSSQIVQVLKDAIDPNQPIGIRLKGAAQWLDIEKSERQLEMNEEEHIAKMTRDELSSGLAEKIAQNPMLASLLAERALAAEQVVDAEVVEEEDGDRSAA